MTKKIDLRLFFVSLFIFLSVGVSSAQKTDPGIDALINQNADYLIQRADNSIHLTIGQTNRTADKKLVIQSAIDFVREQSFSRYTIRHRGTSADGAQRYIIANLSSSQGTYRLFMHYSIETKRLKEIRMIQT